MRTNALTLVAVTVLLTLGLVSMAGCGGESAQTDTGESAPSGETATSETAAEPETGAAEEKAVNEERDMSEYDGPTATLTYFEGGQKQTREVPYLPEGRKVATIETNKGTIKVELWEDKAPNTVVNFVWLANSGRYDGVAFHRVIDGFMAQTGDVEHKGGYGGPGYTIPAEFNEDLKHERGVVSMARGGDPDSAGSQFFIMLADASHLDGKYAAFGEVISGMDVVDSIKKGDRANNGTVEDPDIIEKVRVETVD